MKCKIAWREMGKSKGFFIMCCAVAFVGSTLAYYGMRVLLSAYALTPSAGNAYDYKNFFSYGRMVYICHVLPFMLRNFIVVVLIVA